MATVNLGAIKFNWKGAYNNSTAYVADDVVSSGGNSYVCILASTGNAVSNGTYWSLMASAGADGSDGTNGTNGTNGTDVGTVITTQGDVLYRDGSGLQRLAKGTASQVLAINSGATAPEWVDAGGGGMTLLSRVEITNSNTSRILFTGMLTDTYDTYFFVGQAGCTYNGTYNYSLEFGNGGTYYASTNNYAGSTIFNYDNSSTVNGTPTNSYSGRFDLTGASARPGNARWIGISGYLYFTRTTDDAATVSYRSAYSNAHISTPTATSFYNASGSGYYHGNGQQSDSTKTMSDVAFHGNNGNHRPGSWICLYGINKS
jgi:hypothetical protein